MYSIEQIKNASPEEKAKMRMSLEKSLTTLYNKSSQYNARQVDSEEGLGSFFKSLAGQTGEAGAGATAALLSSAFEPSSNVVEGTRSVGEWFGSLVTPEQRAQQEEAMRIYNESKGTGTWGEIKGATSAFLSDPTAFGAQAVGSIVPTVAAGLLTGGTGAVAVGGLQGAGAVRLNIYDSVLNEALTQGYTEDQAKTLANKAASYAGDNIDQIMLGGGIGALAGRFGAEAPIISKALTKSAIQKGGALAGKEIVEKQLGRIGEQLATSKARKVGGQILTEGLTEAAQGGQEQLAGNLALQRRLSPEIDITEGIAQAATLEGLMGGMAAGGLGGFTTPGKTNLLRQQKDLVQRKDRLQEYLDKKNVTDPSPEKTDETFKPKAEPTIDDVAMKSTAVTLDAFEKWVRTGNIEEDLLNAIALKIVNRGDLTQLEQQIAAEETGKINNAIVKYQAEQTSDIIQSNEIPDATLVPKTSKILTVAEGEPLLQEEQTDSPKSKYSVLQPRMKAQLDRAAVAQAEKLGISDITNIEDFEDQHLDTLDEIARQEGAEDWNDYVNNWLSYYRIVDEDTSTPSGESDNTQPPLLQGSSLRIEAVPYLESQPEFRSTNIPKTILSKPLPVPLQTEPQTDQEVRENLLIEEQETIPEITLKQDQQTISTPVAGGIKSNVVYDVIDVDDLAKYVQSTIGETQTRDRKSGLSQEQVKKISLNPDPQMLLESTVSDNGAPVVRNGVVLSGNGRSLGIISGLKENNDKQGWKEYNRNVLELSKKYGLSDKASSMKNPVLVRRLVGLSDKDVGQFVKESNTSDILQESNAETGILDFDVIAPELETLEFNEDGEISLASIYDVAKFFEAANRPVKKSSDGSYDIDALRKRLLTASLVGVFKSAGTNNPTLLNSFVESGDSKRIFNAFISRSGRISKLPKEFSLSDLFIGALARRNDDLDQKDLFNEYNPTETEIAKFFQKNKNKSTTIKEALDSFLSEIENEYNQSKADDQYGDLFSETESARQPIIPAESVTRAITKAESIANSKKDLQKLKSGELPPELSGVKNTKLGRALSTRISQEVPTSLKDTLAVIKDTAWSFMGDRNKKARQEFLSKLTGTKVPIAKSGVNAIIQEVESRLANTDKATNQEPDTQKQDKKQDINDLPLSDQEKEALRLTKTKTAKEESSGMFYFSDSFFSATRKNKLRSDGERKNKKDPSGGKFISIKRKSDVTGIPTDKGWYIIDRRKSYLDRTSVPTSTESKSGVKADYKSIWRPSDKALKLLEKLYPSMTKIAESINNDKRSRSSGLDGFDLVNLAVYGKPDSDSKGWTGSSILRRYDNGSITEKQASDLLSIAVNGKKIDEIKRSLKSISQEELLSENLKVGDTLSSSGLSPDKQAIIEEEGEGVKYSKDDDLQSKKDIAERRNDLQKLLDCLKSKTR